MFSRLKKMSLTTMVFTAMALGAVCGLVFGPKMTAIGFIGDIWLNCIKMIIVPMIIGTVVSSIAAQKDAKALGRIGWRIMLYYIATTLVACAVGLIVASILKPGVGVSLVGMEGKEVSGAANFTVATFFSGFFSSNMFQSFTAGNIIQTLVISLMLGIAILRLTNEKQKEIVSDWFNAINAMIFSLIDMIMRVSPIGIFCLMAATFGAHGIGVFISMASLAGTFYAACIIHVLIVYCGILALTARVGPVRFIRDTMPVWVYTISTCSSIAAIPVAIKVAKEKFNVPERISSFTIPLGSQMNYDGGVILFGCVIVFISQSIGINLSIGTMIHIVLLGALLSSGGGGIPGSNIVKLFIMVEAFGLPTEIVGIVAAFYRIFDMGTTTNNCLGDLAGTISVSALEERRDAREAIAIQKVA